MVGGGWGGSDLAEKMISPKDQTVTKGSEKCCCIVLLFLVFVLIRVCTKLYCHVQSYYLNRHPF